jgi:hypothetical protein
MSSVAPGPCRLRYTPLSKRHVFDDGDELWLKLRNARNGRSSIGRKLVPVHPARTYSHVFSRGLHFQCRFACIESQDPDPDGPNGDDGDQPTGRS